MPVISLIAAVAEDMAIGKNNDLLCHLPNDLKHFKALTLNHTVVMGRRTFESLPGGALKNRKNIVLTSDAGACYPDTTVCRSIAEALQDSPTEKEIFIIGGATVYRQTIDTADRLYITEIHHTFEEADVFFPAIDTAVWKEVSRETFPADEKHRYAYSFVTYERIR
ncbi:MAG: dihydrofolate reductase [Coprobacter sp.]|nr:dihydrofolate reductase [Coprobacter sp.]